jgi:hypothetical protein
LADGSGIAFPEVLVTGSLAPYMQLVSPSVVAMAVRMEMSMLIIIFHVSFLIGSDMA